METRKQKAWDMRRQGKSYSEISLSLFVAKSTLSYWFRKDSNSKKIRQRLTKRAQKASYQRLRLMAEANKERWKTKRGEWRKSAEKDFKTIKMDPAFWLGIGLYWGEGDKKLQNGIVRLGNVDSELLRVFVLFLQRYGCTDKGRIKAWILLYPDLNEVECKKFWSAQLQLPPSQFMKPQRVSGKGKIRRRVSHGVCYIYVSSRELKEKIMMWIELVSKELQPNAGIV